MAAGKLRTKLSFQRRGTSDDGFGTVTRTGEFEHVFFAMAEVKPRFGSEPVIAGRLQGVQPYSIVIRQCDAARAVDAAWRAVGAHSGAIYSIVSPAADETQKGAYLEFLVVSGEGGQ